MPNNNENNNNMDKPKRKYSNKRKPRKDVAIIEASSDEEIEIDVKTNTQTNTQTQTNTWVDKLKSVPVPVKPEENSTEDNDDGSDKPLTHTWVLWSHDIISDNWETREGFDELHLIDSASSFWKVMNNLTILGMDCMHFYIMREGVVPIWESPENVNGCNCSIKFEFSEAFTNYEYLSGRMITNSLLEDPDKMDEIYGIAISPKINARNSSAIIKIWNKDYKVDVSKLLCPDILKKYDSHSVQYRPHDKNVNFKHTK